MLCIARRLIIEIPAVLSKDSSSDGETGKSWTLLACLRSEEQQFSFSLKFLTGVIGP